MATLPVLTIPQLHQLAKLVYLQEDQAIHSIQFESEPARVKYLRKCKACYDDMVAFLNEASSFEQEYPDDSTKAPIASDIFGFMVNGANFGLQRVTNYALRIDYLKKIRDCSTEIRNELAEVADNDETETEKVAEKANDYRAMALELVTKGQVSPVSHQFLAWLKESGLNYMELIQFYQQKRNYAGLFKDLKDTMKIQIYGDILEASGRPKFQFQFKLKDFGRGSIVFIIFTAGFMVWDLFTDAHDIVQTATRDAVVAVASVGGALVGEVIGVAVATAAGLTGGIVLMAGLLTGIAGAFLVGEFVGFCIDSMFAGSYDTLSTEGFRCYVAELPNGEALARQIVHHTN